MSDPLKLRLVDKHYAQTPYGKGLIVGVRALQSLVGWPLPDEYFIYFPEKVSHTHLGKGGANFLWIDAESIKLLKEPQSEEERERILKESSKSIIAADGRPEVVGKVFVKKKSDKEQLDLF